MTLKNLFLILLAIIALYSAETNATSINANKCTLGLLPFSNNMNEQSKRDEIFKAYEKKGYNVFELKTPSEIQDVEFISDASVECTSTYFGIMAKTSVRLVETLTNKVISQTTSPASMDLFNCKIDLFSAINALPDCQIK